MTDDGVEDTTWLESIATLLAGKPPAHWDDQDRARFEVQLAASARNFEHYRVLAMEMERTGYALLDGDKSMLLVSITAPDRGGVEKVVQVPPEMSPARRTRAGGGPAGAARRESAGPEGRERGHPRRTGPAAHERTASVPE